jgi:5-methylcytosine-specific restriction enzyme subunit McrC
LRELGKRLARNPRAGLLVPGRRPRKRQRSVIHLQRTGNECLVRVVDAIGTIALPSLILDVKPKIPGRHLLYLLERGELLPRLEAEQTTLQADQTLLELVARWYVAALGKILEEGLARDYRSEHGECPAVRGRLLALPTARLYYGGRLSVVSEYEEFDFDTPLNRLLLAATKLLVGHPAVPWEVQARARRATLRMDGIGPLRHGDVHVGLERRTGYYRDAALLAKHIVQGVGRALEVGGERVWTFLIRTPEAVEEGMRSVLIEGLPALEPRKEAITLRDTTMTLNPDVVFADKAIADVKHKLAARRWRRADLYQLIAFATGFDVSHAAMIDFVGEHAPTPPNVNIGRVLVTHLGWPAIDSLTPHAACQALVDQAERWASTWIS